MGHELWTSPITGYRRKGTRLAELRAILGAGITARAILEPLRSCAADASATEIAESLRRRDFDVAGVKIREVDPVIGFVEGCSLKRGIIRDFMKELTADRLVSDGIALPSLLTFLEARQHAFVLVGSSVAGIVTRADLNKPPVRVYLFGLVSLLEMHLGFWVRRGYPGDSWKAKLSGARLAAANRLLADRRRRNEDVGLFECLQFCDKRDLFVRHPDLSSKLGIRETQEPTNRLKRAESLRNHLAHSQDDIVRGSSWEKVIALVQWVEEVVHASDVLIERNAGRSLKRKSGPDLWASA